MFVVWGLLMFLLLLGFPFFVMVVANKQDGWLKIAGWILAGLFVLFLVIGSIFAVSGGGMMGKGMMGGKMMGGGGMGVMSCPMMSGGMGGGMMGGSGGMMMGSGMGGMMGNQGNMPKMDPEMAKMMEKEIADLKMKYEAKMMGGTMMENDKMIDAFLEKMRADPKMFEMFKEKVNKPAPKNP